MDPARAAKHASRRRPRVRTAHRPGSSTGHSSANRDRRSPRGEVLSSRTVRDAIVGSESGSRAEEFTSSKASPASGRSTWRCAETRPSPTSTTSPNPAAHCPHRRLGRADSEPLQPSAWVGTPNEEALPELLSHVDTPADLHRTESGSRRASLNGTLWAAVLRRDQRLIGTPFRAGAYSCVPGRDGEGGRQLGRAVRCHLATDRFTPRQGSMR